MQEKILEAKKLLEQHAPKNEFLAYISKEEAKILEGLGGSGKIIEETGIPSFQVTEQRSLYNPKVEALTEQYAGAMGTLAQQPFTGADITSMAPQVAPQTALQQQATQRTTAGLGAYEDYVTAAGQAGTAAGTALGQAGTQLGTAEAGLAGIGAQYAAPAVAGLQ